MDIAVIHNFGEHPGGGDLVALSIIETLLEKKFNIYLYTSMPEGIWKAVEYFKKDPEIFENMIVKRVEVPRFIIHPYNIYFITRKTLNELRKYNLVIFFDDIPKPAQELNKIFVYVHYPHATRILLNQLVPYRYKITLRGKFVWRVHSILFRSCFLINWRKTNIYAVTNSRLTYHHVLEALKPIHLAKIYPPVLVGQIIEFMKRNQGGKEDTVVYIGRIQPEKGIEDIIKAAPRLKEFKDIDLKIKIMGFNFDYNYLLYLRKLVRKLGVVKQVEINVNVSRKEVLEALAKAKVIVHPARYEPFGIAVVEGMAAGCVPVVRRGYNGPWIDIMEQGRYGYGFASVEELSRRVYIALNKWNSTVPYIINRAKIFSEKIFKHNVMNHVLRITTP